MKKTVNQTVSPTPQQTYWNRAIIKKDLLKQFDSNTCINALPTFLPRSGLSGVPKGCTIAVYSYNQGTKRKKLEFLGTSIKYSGLEYTIVVAPFTKYRKKHGKVVKITNEVWDIIFNPYVDESDYFCNNETVSSI